MNAAQTSSATEQAAQLNEDFEKLSAPERIERAAFQLFKGRFCVVSSFGAESAVLLHLMASVDPAIPVLFLDTQKLFGETIRYRSRLQHVIGLEDVRIIGPRRSDIEKADPQGTLSMHNPDACCQVRKAEPLSRALGGFDCWASGRKRHQTSFRSQMGIVEHDGSHFKLNPLADWEPASIRDYINQHNLPEHPLVKDGYYSIGCLPCTSKVVDKDDMRSGRWAGQPKTECGIHLKSEPE